MSSRALEFLRTLRGKKEREKDEEIDPLFKDEYSIGTCVCQKCRLKEGFLALATPWALAPVPYSTHA
jgi:hypothetical protein